jgi:hypothetical protein
VVGCKVRKTHKPADRGAVDDRSTTLLEHLAELKAHAVPDAAQIDAHDALVVRCGHLGDRRSRDLDPGIVEGRVDRTKGRDSLGHHRFDLGHSRDIAGNGMNPVAGGRQFVRCRFEGKGVEVDQHDGCSGLCERLGGRQPKTHCRSGDERNLAFKRYIHVGFPIFCA